MNLRYDCMIVGGGAAGLAAAAALGARGCRAVILEKQDRVGRKLLSTGNGRCNLTNLRARPESYHGDVNAARAALAAHPPEDVLRFFDGIGVPFREEAEGRVYPMSGQAASVLDALRLTAAERGIDTLSGFGVERLARRKSGFAAVNAAGEEITADRALVCTGGLAAPKLGGCGDGYRLLAGFGHRLAPRFPAVSPLKTPPECVKGLKGQRLDCAVKLVCGDTVLRAEEGELLFGDTGVSGIAAMQLAREASAALARGKKPVLRIEILPDGPEFTRKRAEKMPLRAAEDFLTGAVPKRVGQALLRAAGAENQASPVCELPEAVLKRLGELMQCWEMPVTGVCGFDQAQATAGGAVLDDFIPETLESRLEKGLFAAGEVLNIDGDCGGFNLQWAWASALTAAEAMA